MKTISSYDAKAQFSALLKTVAQGESVIVTRHGKPVAQIVAVAPGTVARQRGPLAPHLRANCSDAEALTPVFAGRSAVVVD